MPASSSCGSWLAPVCRAWATSVGLAKAGSMPRAWRMKLSKAAARSCRLRSADAVAVGAAYGLGVAA